MVSVYCEVLLRWGPLVAMQGCRALIARDAQSNWFNVDN